MNVILSDSSEFENSDSSFDDESSFTAFTTTIEDFPEVMVAESKSELDDDDSEVAIVDTDHQLSIQDTYNDM